MLLLLHIKSSNHLEMLAPCLKVDQVSSNAQWYVDQLLDVIQGKASGIQALAEQAELCSEKYARRY